MVAREANYAAANAPSYAPSDAPAHPPADHGTRHAKTRFGDACRIIEKGLKYGAAPLDMKREFPEFMDGIDIARDADAAEAVPPCIHRGTPQQPALVEKQQVVAQSLRSGGMLAGKDHRGVRGAIRNGPLDQDLGHGIESEEGVIEKIGPRPTTQHEHHAQTDPLALGERLDPLVALVDLDDLLDLSLFRRPGS